MAKFVEVLKDGLTLAGAVRLAGARVQVSEDLSLLSKKKQVKRWGAPRYRQITEADFTGVGGELADEGSLITPIPEGVGQPVEEDKADEGTKVETTITPEDKFAAVSGLNIEDTLLAVSAFSEADLAEFIAYESAGQARVGVLEPLGVGGE